MCYMRRAQQKYEAKMHEAQNVRAYEPTDEELDARATAWLEAVR